MSDYIKRHEPYIADLSKFAPDYPDLKINTILITKGDEKGQVKVIYKSNKGNVYSNNFGRRDNTVLLLMYFSENQDRIFTTRNELEELASELKNEEEHSRKGTSSYNRIRYTIDYFRNKLGLKDKKEEDPFVSRKGFGVKCSIEVSL